VRKAQPPAYGISSAAGGPGAGIRCASGALHGSAWVVREGVGESGDRPYASAVRQRSPPVQSASAVPAVRQRKAGPPPAQCRPSASAVPALSAMPDLRQRNASPPPAQCRPFASAVPALSAMPDLRQRNASPPPAQCLPPMPRRPSASAMPALRERNAGRRCHAGRPPVPLNGAGDSAGVGPDQPRSRQHGRYGDVQATYRAFLGPYRGGLTRSCGVAGPPGAWRVPRDIGSSRRPARSASAGSSKPAALRRASAPDNSDMSGDDRVAGGSLPHWWLNVDVYCPPGGRKCPRKPKR